MLSKIPPLVVSSFWKDTFSRLLQLSPRHLVHEAMQGNPCLQQVHTAYSSATKTFALTADKIFQVQRRSSDFQVCWYRDQSVVFHAPSLSFWTAFVSFDQRPLTNFIEMHTSKHAALSTSIFWREKDCSDSMIALRNSDLSNFRIMPFLKRDIGSEVSSNSKAF